MLRPLFIGIMGAGLMRLSFLSGAEYLMHTVWFMHLVFGLLLVVIGVRSVPLAGISLLFLR